MDRDDEKMHKSTEIIEKVDNVNPMDLISNAVSYVPAPIKKSAIKAFSQLCTAAIDFPIAYLEGIAAEKRAETQARLRIINTGAEQIANKMEIDPEYARVAVRKFGQKIVQEQVNLDIISENAAQEITHIPPENINRKSESETSIEDEISTDWLNVFEKEARNKSSDEMRLLFGKILAGEILKPSSYSIKTVKIISQLDNKAAKLFQVYCSLCISLRLNSQILDGRVLSLGGNVGANSLKDYGLNFNDLNVLHEYGMIIQDYNSYMDYRICIPNIENQVEFAFTYQGKLYILIPQGDRKDNSNFKLHGVALSKSGKELLNIIDILPSQNYTTALKEYFQTQNLKMVNINQ